MAGPGSISFSSTSRLGMSLGSTAPSSKFAKLPANSESSAAISPLLVNRGGPRTSPESKKDGDAVLLTFTSCTSSTSSLAIAALGIAHSAGVGNVVFHSTQTPSQPLGHLVSCAPQSRLQRILGDSELLGRLACRITLHFAQKERRAQQRRKLVEVLADHLSQFRASKNLLRIRRVVRKPLRRGQFVLARCFVQRKRRARLRAPPPHQRRVVHDARQPGRKLRPPLEPLQVPLGREQSVLQRVFRVLRVPQHTQRGLKQRPLVSAEEGFYRLVVASLSGADQLLFIQLRSHCHLRCHHYPPIYVCKLVAGPRNFSSSVHRPI